MSPLLTHRRFSLILVAVVEYADLTILDLSKAQTPEGLAQLAQEARDALHDQGFLYIINHGLPAEDVSADRLRQ